MSRGYYCSWSILCFAWCLNQYTKCSCRVLKIWNKFRYSKNHSIFSVISAVMTLKLDPTCSSFNPFPSLPSLATNERKQFQCLNIVLNNKTEQLFLEFSWSEGTFKLFKKIANSVTLHLSPGERENHNWKVALTRWLTTIPHWHSGQRASLDSSKMITLPLLIF